VGIIKQSEDAEAPAGKAKKPFKVDVPAPQEIKAYLDQYVVGQNHTKKVLSVAVHNHYSRINLLAKGADPMPDVELDKSNVLLVGPSGTGKTLLVQTIARMLKVPCAISDATTLTEAGYVGSDIETILLKVYQAAKGDVGATEMGIVMLDEICKKAKRDEGVSITRDVSGEGVQAALLKILEGCESDVPLAGGRKHPSGETVRINTRSMLFVMSGAFIGLDKIVEARMRGKGVIGFGTNELAAGRGMKNILPEDLIAFGLIPELVGRVPVVSRLEALSEKDLLHILTEPKNCIVKQYEKMAKLSGASLAFNDDALSEIARIAFSRETGARGLRSIVESLLLDFMFDIHKGSSITITKQDVVQMFDNKALVA